MRQEGLKLFRALLLALFAAACASAQIQVILPTDNGSVSLGKINSNFSYLNFIKPNQFAGPGAPGFVSSSKSGDFYRNTTNNTDTYQCFIPVGSCTAVATANWVLISGGSSGGGSAWNALTSGTNTTMTAIMGSGSQLTFTGSGIINANRINGVSLGGLGTGILKNTTGTGIPSLAGTADVLALWSGTCNSGTFLRGDGSCQTPATTNPSFSAITPGTNTGALVMGTGGSLGRSGSGIIDANQINNVALASLATGLLKNTTGTGVPSAAAAADVVALFTSCSGTQYLGADGACHTASAGSSTDNLVTTTTTVITQAIGGNHGWGGINTVATSAATITFASGTDSGTFYTGWTATQQACYYGSGITIGHWTVANFAGATCTSGTPPADGSFWQTASITVASGVVSLSPTDTRAYGNTGKAGGGTCTVATSTAVAYDPTCALTNTGSVDFSTATPTQPIQSGGSDPATCTSGKGVFINTASTPVMKLCTATNTWTAIGSGSSTAKVPVWAGNFSKLANVNGGGGADASAWQIGGAAANYCAANLTGGNPPEVCELALTTAAGQNISYMFPWDTAYTAIDLHLVFGQSSTTAGNFRFKATLYCNTLGTSIRSGTWTAGTTTTTSTIVAPGTANTGIALDITGINIPTCAATSPMVLNFTRDQTVGSNDADDARLYTGSIIATRTLP